MDEPASSELAAGPAVSRWRALGIAQARRSVLTEAVKIKGLMPLLMKRRNGGRWTRAEREALLDQMRALAHLSPYLVLLVLPGSFVVVPLFAWWLDRRRNRRIVS